MQPKAFVHQEIFNDKVGKQRLGTWQGCIKE